MPDGSVLTSGERAVLFEIGRQFEGCAFVSYSWLRMCTEPDAGATRPDYPSNDRTLNRAVTQLVNREFVKRLRTQDRGSFHGLIETWNRLTPEIQNEIVTKDMEARGTKTEVSFLILGPAALPDDLRRKIWGGPPGVAEPGVAFEFRGLRVGEETHDVNVGPLPQTIPAGEYRVRSDVRLVNMVMSHPRKFERQ